jgi:hypothetical protein
MMTSALADYEQLLAFLVVCCAKATVLLAGAWLIVVALRQSSSALRHHVWTAAILASLALPFFAMLLPAWHSATLGSAATFWSPAHANAGSPISHTIPSSIVNVTASPQFFNRLAGVTLLAWTVGASFFLLRLLVGLARLAWVSAHAKPVFDDDWMHTVLELSKFHKIGRPVRLLLRNSSTRTSPAQLSKPSASGATLPPSSTENLSKWTPPSL